MMILKIIQYFGQCIYLLKRLAILIVFQKRNPENWLLKLCSVNISKDFSEDNMTKTGLNGYVYDFSVDYDTIAVDDILNIYMYLMKKNNIK